MAADKSSPAARLAAWLLALTLVVLGAKLWAIQIFGSSLPFWDQWDEAKQIFIPWLDGRLTWTALFAPHNEHRILFTRLLDVFELWFNGQWDPKLQMVVNAFIHTAYAGGLAVSLWLVLGRKWPGLICICLAPFFALPFAADNTIHGFQSQEYFLSIFSVVAIAGLGFATPGKPGWWVGLAAALLSLFTMASGLLAPVAVAALLLARMLKQKGPRRNLLVTLAGCLAAAAAGIFLNVTKPEDKSFQAHSFLEFIDALTRNLAWPFWLQPLMLFVICLPLLLLAVQYFRSRDEDLRAAEFVLALGLWGFLQSAALAYGRAESGDSSRYLDSLATIPVAGLAALFVLANRVNFRPIHRQLAAGLAVVWVAICYWGLWQNSGIHFGNQRTITGYLREIKLLNLIEETNVRGFVATGDTTYLLGQPPFHIPYPNGTNLLKALQDPELRTILPPICLPPMPLVAATSASAGFVLNGCPPEKPGRDLTLVWGDYPPNPASPDRHFVSEPLIARLPELNLQVCCGTNLNGIDLQLVELSTGRTIKLRPQIVGRWHTLSVPAPRNPFRLEITDRSRDSWIAAGEMSQIGRWSVYASSLLNHATLILLAGLGLGALLCGWNFYRHSTISDASGLFNFLALLAILAALLVLWPARTINLSAFDSDSHKNLAEHFATEHKYNSAELHFRESLWLQPGDAVALVRLGDVLLSNPRLDKNQARAAARLDYEAALQLAPGSLEIQKRLRDLGQLPVK